MEKILALLASLVILVGTSELLAQAPAVTIYGRTHEGLGRNYWLVEERQACYDDHIRVATKQECDFCSGFRRIRSRQALF